MPPSVIDSATLRAALVGYQIEKESIEGKITEIRKRLGQRAGRVMSASPPGRRTRTPLSAAARKRIAAAQKKRWAAYRRAKSAK